MDAAIRFLEGKLLIAISQNELVSVITWSVLASQRLAFLGMTVLPDADLLLSHACTMAYPSRGG